MAVSIRLVVMLYLGSGYLDDIEAYATLKSTYLGVCLVRLELEAVIVDPQ
jgi:hypothetical protein